MPCGDCLIEEIPEGTPCPGHECGWVTPEDETCGKYPAPFRYFCKGKGEDELTWFWVCADCYDLIAAAGLEDVIQEFE
jgi:hypothetical protein